MQEAPKPEVVKVVVKKSSKKRKIRKPKVRLITQAKEQKPAKVEKPVTEEVKP